MAEYRFEANPEGVNGTKLKIIARNENWLSHHRGHLTRNVLFSESVTGILTIENMTELEAEIVRRGIVAVASDFYVPPTSQRPVKFTASDQVEKLKEQESGTSTTQAELGRSQCLDVNRADRITTTRLNDPRISSFAGNLLVVRAIMLDGIREEYRKDGQAEEGHFVEVAINAQRMAGEIQEEIEPQLLEVNDLFIAGIQEMLDADSLVRVPIGQPF